MNLNRRRFLLGSALAAAVVATGGRVRAAGVAVGPSARVEPVSEAFFGQTVTDPYRWMENSADPDWMPWLEANDAHARSQIEALPAYDATLARLRTLGVGSSRISLPYEFDGRLLFLRQSASAGWPALVVRENGVDRVVFDPGISAGPIGDVSLEFWGASPDGRYMALGLGEGGTEEATLHILDLRAERLLSERISRCLPMAPYWLEDGSGFFYTQLGIGQAGTLDYRADVRCRLHRIGDDPSRDPIMLSQGQYPDLRVDRHDTVEIKVMPGSDWAVAQTSTLVGKGLWCTRLADLLAGRAQWRELFSPDSGSPDHVLDGDSLWVWGPVSDEESVISRLDLLQAPELVETTVATLTGGALITQTALSDGGLYVSVDSGSTSQLFFAPRAGKGTREIPLPQAGSIGDLAYGQGRRGVFVYLSTWLEQPTVWKLSPQAAPTRLELSQDPVIDTSGYEVADGDFAARDGERIPVTVLASRRLRRTGTAPCRVTAYGAYGQSLTAAFDPLNIALLEQGGIVVIAHVRGGGERGRRWWMAGQGATKPNTWRDLIDVCQALVDDGWTTPERLAITGGSAGGITVGRAMTERPDLFGLVDISAGLLNPLRFEFEANGLANVAEFGSLATPDGFQALFAMDTLQHIQDGTRYPTVHLTHGVNDTRVATWHSGKAAARLRAAAPADGAPVLFRVNFASGHILDSVEEAIQGRIGTDAWLLSRA